MTEQASDAAQIVPVYFAYDATTSMGAPATTTTNQLLGELAAAITRSPENARSVRLCVLGLDASVSPRLLLTDLDASAEVPMAVLGTEDQIGPGVLVDVRAQIDDDWEHLRADGLARQRPLLVLVTQGRAATVTDWRGTLRDPGQVIDDADAGARVWPPQLVVVGVGPAVEADLLPLRLDDDDVVELATAGVARTADVLADVLAGRVSVGGDQLLRRWAVPLHELGRCTAVGTRGDRDVFDTATGDPDGAGRAVQFLRYPTPFRLGDAVRGVLSATALQESDLADRMRRQGIHLTWPVRIVVADDDVGTVLGVLEEEVPPSGAPRRTLPITDLRCDPSCLPGPQQLDPVLTTAENAALFALRACRSFATAVKDLHADHVVIGAAAEEVRIDADDLGLLVDRIDLMTVVASGDDEGDGLLHEDLRRLAELVALVLGPQPGGDAGILGIHGEDMLAQARAGAPVTPPPADEWADYLDHRIVVLLGPPRVLDLEATPAVVPVGDTVSLLWRTRFADSVTIHLPGAQTVAVAAGEVASGSKDVRVTTSGRVRLEARNRAGVVEADFPRVHIFDPVQLVGAATSALGDPVGGLQLPPLPVVPQPTGAGDMPPYPQVLAHTQAVDTGLEVLAEAAAGLRALMEGSRNAASPGGQAPLGPDPLDPAGWFGAPPALPAGRRRRWKG